MISRRAFWSVAACAYLVAACGGSGAPRTVNLPTPSEKSPLGPGDILSIQIVGEKELPHEFQVAADGTLELPYVHTIKVAGLEGPEVARLLREKLIEKQVLTDPIVIVQVKEYHSRRITLLGQVSKPGSFAFSQGLTLVGAVSLAGGFTAIAKAGQVRLTRKLDTGVVRTVVVDADAIIEGRSPDVPLQPGDQIYIEDRLF